MTCSAAAQPSTYTCGTDTITNTPQCDGYTKAVTTLQYPNDSSSWDLIYLPAGTRVTVTCWYPGGADGYWDHTTWNSEFGSMTGHVQDSEIDFGGHTPNEIGLPEC